MGWSYLYDHRRRKYRKEPHHAKKEENPKAAWREEKQMSRDKSKAKWRQHGVPPYLKRHCNKRHRQWEKRLIFNGEDEKLFNKKPKFIYDPWLYW